jgi:hypothetical protein
VPASDWIWLRRWAHGRLPPWARQHLDTEDLGAHMIRRLPVPQKGLNRLVRQHALRLEGRIGTITLFSIDWRRA